MTRDDALFLARRIMDRTEIDQALHLDAIADEIQAGEMLLADKAKAEKPLVYFGVDPARPDADKTTISWAPVYSRSWVEELFMGGRGGGKTARAEKEAAERLHRMLEERQFKTMYGKT